MLSSGLLRRVVLTRATRRNNPEDTILHKLKKILILNSLYSVEEYLDRDNKFQLGVSQ
jgi:hypothetical protein